MEGTYEGDCGLNLSWVFLGSLFVSSHFFCDFVYPWGQCCVWGEWVGGLWFDFSHSVGLFTLLHISFTISSTFGGPARYGGNIGFGGCGLGLSCALHVLICSYFFGGFIYSWERFSGGGGGGTGGFWSGLFYGFKFLGGFTGFVGSYFFRLPLEGLATCGGNG